MKNQDIISNYMEHEVMANHPAKNQVLIFEKCISKFRLISRLFETFQFKEADKQLNIMEAVFLEMKGQIGEKTDTELANDLHELYNWIIGEIQKMKMVRNGESVKGIEVVLWDLIEGYEGVMNKSGDQ